MTAANQAIALNPQNNDAYEVRGLAYEISGDNASAIKDLTTAISINPLKGWHFAHWARVFYTLGRENEARQDAL